MKRHTLSLIAMLLCTAPYPVSAATDLPVDDRIKIFTYSMNDVYTVPTKYGYQTSIVFAPNEEIGTVSVGDRSMWQIVPSGNRIFIRPMDDDLTTNMTVITNMREYTFDIKSVGEDEASNLYVIQFRYPDKKPKEQPDVVPTPVAELPELAPVVSANVAIPPLDTQRTQQLNRLYTYSGPDRIAPADVYDDGKNTFIVYNSLPSPLPKPLVSSPPGGPAVAVNRIEGNTMVVQTVAGSIQLVSPNGDVTVYNESFQAN